MEIIVGIIVGGLIVWLLTKRTKPSGTFVIDVSNPDKDLCTLELDENLNIIYSKKQIILRVKVFGENSLN